MAADDTAEVVGVASSDGAVHEAWLVCAPNHVPPAPAQTTQQVPLEARATRVMLSVVDEVATLTTDELDDGPLT